MSTTTTEKPAPPKRGKKRGVTFDASVDAADDTKKKPTAPKGKKPAATTKGARKKKTGVAQSPLTSLGVDSDTSLREDVDADALAQEFERELALQMAEEAEDNNEAAAAATATTEDGDAPSPPLPAPPPAPAAKPVGKSAPRGKPTATTSVDQLSPHMRLHGGNFETTMIQVRRRTDEVLNCLRDLMNDENAFVDPKRTVAQCLLMMEEMGQHLVRTQTDFERTLRQIKCRAWASSVNDANSETLGPYALAGVWR